MITIRIIKLPLPPGVQDLAKKIEDALSDLIIKAVKSKITVDNDPADLECTAYESISKTKTS
jgi:hypothetical protein